MILSARLSPYIFNDHLSLFPHSASARVGLEKNRLMFFFNLKHIFTDLFIVFNPRAPQHCVWMPLFLNSDFLLKTPPSPILMRLFPDTSLHFSPKTEWSCCCVIRVWWRCVTVVVIVVVVVGWIEGGVLGGVEAGKFRNCLIFPRKGCKKSLEMYRILFLNSSFIDLFLKDSWLAAATLPF